MYIESKCKSERTFRATNSTSYTWQISKLDFPEGEASHENIFYYIFFLFFHKWPRVHVVDVEACVIIWLFVREEVEDRKWKVEEVLELVVIVVSFISL